MRQLENVVLSPNTRANIVQLDMLVYWYKWFIQGFWSWTKRSSVYDAIKMYNTVGCDLDRPKFEKP